MYFWKLIVINSKGQGEKYLQKKTNLDILNKIRTYVFEFYISVIPNGSGFFGFFAYNYYYYWW